MVGRTCGYEPGPDTANGYADELRYKGFAGYRAYGDDSSYGNVSTNSEEGRRLWLSVHYEC